MLICTNEQQHKHTDLASSKRKKEREPGRDKHRGVQIVATMVRSALIASLACSAAAFAPQPAARNSVQLSETVADLEALAQKANPVVKFYDPLNLSDQSFWGKSNEETIAWLRQSEIKHGRIASEF